MHMISWKWLTAALALSLSVGIVGGARPAHAAEPEAEPEEALQLSAVDEIDDEGDVGEAQLAQRRRWDGRWRDDFRRPGRSRACARNCESVRRQCQYQRRGRYSWRARRGCDRLYFDCMRSCERRGWRGGRGFR
jgi:hypothetical protein